jgi:hypothetical protein
LAARPDNVGGIWTFPGTASVAGENQSALAVATIEWVEPLDAQFGVDPKKTVPDALRKVLFGQPEASADVASARVLGTFAIIDAAKIFGLPEMLAGSGLAHRCLFADDAYENLRDVGPWVVRLDEANEFTRHLFTKGNAPWQMWGKEPGIFLRAWHDLASLQQHLQQYLLAQSDRAARVYVRFWEPRWTRELLETMAAADRMSFFVAIDTVICTSASGRCDILREAAIPEG